MTGEHLAQRPSWDCLACDKPCPCGPARERMVGEMDEVQLAIYAWRTLEDVAADQPTMSAAEMFDRFLAWTRRPSPAPRA